MPTHEQHVLITWIPESKDGQREATRLHSLYRRFSVLKAPGKLTKPELGQYMSVILVGHRKELNKNGHNLMNFLRDSDCSWLVLATCHSGVSQRHGALGNNELWSPAQFIANRLKMKVSATRRPLTFDEVGKGYAFTLTLGEVLIRTNYAGSGELWKDFEPQSGLDEITEGLSNI